MTEYKLTRSKRKTVCIIVHKDASIEVRAPLKMKQTDIDSFISSKEKWIQKTLANLPSIEKIAFGNAFPFSGQDYILKEDKVKRAVISGNFLILPQGKDITTSLNSFLKEQAENYIPERVEQLSCHTGIAFTSVLVNSAKTHWGSCTKDKLHFSCYLMLADKETVDYVIIHELAHILHHNHSVHFWAEVKKHCPDYLTLRNKLKTTSSYVEMLQKTTER